MLQRAASNAYSWWWASHIRTKQSKWLDQNLQEMDEKVQNVLKLVEEDGDSFIKKAEMYYKRRPELIHFIEESYRGYKALAERYDRMSKELQNANNTIAYVFPEQVQFSMEEEEDETSSPKMGPNKTPVPDVLKGNIPKVPKIPKELKGFLSSDKKKAKNTFKLTPGAAKVVKSGLSKEEGLKEIDRLQKEILGLQTEKEFVKSCYEGGLAKYWEIDQQMREMQEKICNLQDEFGAGTIIEDDEARTLMASSALKSCQQTLDQLQQKQEKSAEAVAMERKRINDAREKLNSFKGEVLPGGFNSEKSQVKEDSRKDVEDSKVSIADLTSLSVTALAERIDELVNKVIKLEGVVSSQTGLIERLRLEIDELYAQIQKLQDDKASLTSNKKDFSEKIKQMEEKLQGIEDLNQSFEDQNKNIQTSFSEARSNISQLWEKLCDVTPDEEIQVSSEMKTSKKDIKAEEVASASEDGPEGAKNVISDEKLKVLDESSEGREATPAPVVGVNGSGKSNEESKGTEAALIPDEVVEPQNLQSDEKLDVPGKSNKELTKELPLTINDDVEASGNVKLDDKLDISDKKNKELSRQVASGSDDGLQECQKVESDEKPSGPSQKEMESSVQAGRTMELKEQDEKPIHSDGSKIAIQLKPSNDLDDPARATYDLKMEEEVNKQVKPTTANDVSITETRQKELEQDGEPDWKQLFINVMENKENFLLMEYTTVLSNYKEVKKKLADVENKSDNSLFDTMVQLRELKSANANKDEQIKYLKKKLCLLESGLNNDEGSCLSPMKDSNEGNTDEILMGQTGLSEIEQRFRSNIDEVLEENLDFWFRFSTQFQEIQKFDTEVKDLKSEMSKLEVKLKKQEGSNSTKYSLKSDAKPLYKHLKEIHAELGVWLEKGVLLKDELKSRFSSLCDIQDEIAAALKESAEDIEEFRFTSYQAAKFQGEILNMKQENNKVADELQAGLDHVTSLQHEVDRTLAKLNEEFNLSESNNRQTPGFQHSHTRSSVPLRSFIFGVKAKKQKPSFFSIVHNALKSSHHNL